MCGSETNCAVREEMLLATLPTPQTKGFPEARACLRRPLRDEALTVTQSKSLERLYLVYLADSSFGNARGGAPQRAHMTCAADKDILIGNLNREQLFGAENA